MYSIQKRNTTTPYNTTVEPNLPFYRGMGVRLLIASIFLFFISGCDTDPIHHYSKPEHKRVFKDRVAEMYENYPKADDTRA